MLQEAYFPKNLFFPTSVMHFTQRCCQHPSSSLLEKKVNLESHLAIQLSFLLLFFLFIFTHISLLIFPRIILNLNLSNPAKS